MARLRVQMIIIYILSSFGYSTREINIEIQTYRWKAFRENIYFNFAQRRDTALIMHKQDSDSSLPNIIYQLDYYSSLRRYLAIDPRKRGTRAKAIIGQARHGEAQRADWTKDTEWGKRV